MKQTLWYNRSTLNHKNKHESQKILWQRNSYSLREVGHSRHTLTFPDGTLRGSVKKIYTWRDLMDCRWISGMQGMVSRARSMVARLVWTGHTMSSVSTKGSRQTECLHTNFSICWGWSNSEGRILRVELTNTFSVRFFYLFFKPGKYVKRHWSTME